MNLRNTHLIAGLISGLFVLVMSLSGSVLVFRDEIDKLQQPTIKLTDDPFLTVDKAYYKVRKAFPAAQVNGLSLPQHSHGPLIFAVNDSAYAAGAKTLQVFVHPQTGEVLYCRGVRDAAKNLMGWVAKLHRSLHMGKTGEWLLAVLGTVFGIGLVTGCMLYRRHIFNVLRFQRSIYRWNNLHQIVGVWALLFNMVMVISGVWMQRYVFRSSFYQSSTPYPTTLQVSGDLRYSMDSVLRKADTAYAFTPYEVYFPRKAGGGTAIYGSRKGNAFIHSKRMADAIFLDSTGAVIHTAFIDNISRQDHYDIVNAQIHSGHWGGNIVKMLYCLFGLSSGLLSITGVWLYALHKKEN